MCWNSQWPGPFSASSYILLFFSLIGRDWCPHSCPTGLSVGTGGGKKLGLEVLLVTNTEVASTQLGKVSEIRKTEQERQHFKVKQPQAYSRVQPS